MKKGENKARKARQFTPDILTKVMWKSSNSKIADQNVGPAKNSPAAKMLIVCIINEALNVKRQPHIPILSRQRDLFRV